MKALSSCADIVIGGGAAGAGKTFSLLLEPLRHIHVKGFGAVCFRRTSPMIRSEGGLWDASEKIYRKISGAEARSTILEWKFKAGTKLKFSHMQYEENKFDWQGAEIPLIMFDELTHFSKSVFLYMLSRNRSTCGIKPYIRATCNPDPDSWVADFIEWYIDQDSKSSNYGYPIPERQGVVRFFTNENDNIVWGDSFEDVYNKCKEFIDSEIEKSHGLVAPEDFIKSFTFIGGSIYENRELLKVNPGYLGNLNAQSAEEKLRLLGGNWKISLKGNDVYDFHKFNDIFTNSFVPEGEKYLTTDIAMKGSDKFIIYVWSGKRLIDFHKMDKSKGNQVIDLLKSNLFAHSVQHSNMAFDNDGVGAFVDGFIDGAKEFNNGARPLPNDESGLPENYNHLKSQCFFKSGEAVNRGEYYVTPYAAEKMYDDKMTLRERLLHERKAIKRGNVDKDGKLSVIKKEEMKNYLGGESPDVMDCFMMREFFEYKVNKTQTGGLSVSSGGGDYDYYDEDEGDYSYLNF